MNKPATLVRMRIAAIILVLGACTNHSEVRVQLNAHHQPSDDPRQLDVQAQVTGPQSGLRYKWYSVLGELDPQDSENPKTAYTFATNSARDRVWVEVWRDNQRVAEGNLEVNMDPNTVLANTPRPRVQIEITEVPKYEPAGGPDTRADIGGKVIGDLSKDFSLAIYARADAWYIQPVPYALHPIQADGAWKTWTHTGSSYAVLLVRNDYKPLTRLDVLPSVDGSVLARTIVEGRRP